jgi:hypothetical protein
MGNVSKKDEWLAQFSDSSAKRHHRIALMGDEYVFLQDDY